MKYLAMCLGLAAACTGGSSSSPAPAAKPKAGAADPWAGGKAPVDPAIAAKDPDLARMIELARGGPDAEAYPQADAVIAVLRDDITLRADGTVIEHHKSIVKLLDAQRGKEKFADVHIPFDSKRQTLELQVARTVNADGEPHAASGEEIGDIVPARLADATIYSDVRERVVSFPAVDKGSVIQLEYTRTTKATPDAGMGGEEMLGEWNPVLERVVTITADAAMTPKLEVVGTKVDPVVTQAAGGKVWTYRLTDLPDRQPEQGTPDVAAVLPRLIYSFRPSWQAAVEPVADRFLKAALPATPAASIAETATRVTAGASSNADKARKLFAFVAHDIRSVDLPLGWGGYEPHAPDVVLQNRYADNRDKVALLLALAQAQGITGRPVLVRTGNVPVLSSVPTIAQFDHVIAKLSVDGKDVWLDPSDESGQYALAFAGQDNLVLPLDKASAELVRRPALDPAASVSQVTAKLSLASNGDLDATYRYALTGWYADRATDELRALKGERLAQYFQMAAAGLAASALDKGHDVGDTLSVDGAFEIAHHVVAPGYSAAQGEYRVVELPAPALSVAEDVPSPGLTTRKYPLRVGVPRTHKTDVSLQVPAGWKVTYVPPKMEASADGVTYSSACTNEGRTVSCKAEIKLDQITIAADRYPAFRDALAKLRAYERRIVVLTRG